MKKTSFWRSPGLALLLALLHGGLYVFLIPPWQHYDEPSHFERVWLSAQGLPAETPDLVFRHKLVQSMIANNFYRGKPLPSLESVDTGKKILGLEYSQLDDPPLYYLWASLPVRFLQTRNPAVMLIAARMMSMAFLLLTVLAIWGFTREITPPTSPLRFWVPLSAALLPGFIDLMTAVNNDVGAIAAFTLCLWSSLNFIKHPRSLVALIGLLFTVFLCLGMKSTAYFAAPLALLALMLGWIHGKFAKWVWWLLIFFSGLGTITLLTWHDAASWHRGTSQLLPTRVQTDAAPLGNYALQIDASAPSTPPYLHALQQPLLLPPRNTTLTFGVWMWAANAEIPLEDRTPILNTGPQTFFNTITLDTTPQFFAFSVTLPEDTTHLWLSIAPQASDHLINYDGFVLAEGTFPLDTPPAFTSEEGKMGVWGERPFQNLLRNASAENAWPALRPLVDNQLTPLIPDHARVSTWLFSLFDWPYTRGYFSLTAQNLFETFWGRFGWGHVPLMFPAFYKLLWGISGLALLGMLLGLTRAYQAWDQRFAFLGVTLMLVWGAALFRGEIFIFTSNIFIPGARYAYPAIAPTLFGFAYGWYVWGRHMQKRMLTSQLNNWANVISVLFFVSLCGLSIVSILKYFYTN